MKLRSGQHDYLLKPLNRCLLVILLLVSSIAAHGQDVFRSAGTSTRSYSYVEVQYLTNTDVDQPYLATVLFAINDDWSFTAEYLKAADDATENGITLEVEAEQLGAGLVYHRPFSRLPDTDWVATLMHFEIDASASTLGTTLEGSDSHQEFLLGLRRTLSDKAEGEIGLRVANFDGTDVFGDIRIVIRATDRLDLAIGIREIGGGDLTGVGLRYTW